MTHESTFDIAVPLPGAWAERHAGWILSVCLHVLLFLALMTHLAPPQRPKPEPRRIRLSLRRPEPRPALPAVAPARAPRPAEPVAAPAPVMPPAPRAEPVRAVSGTVPVVVVPRDPRVDAAIDAILERQADAAHEQREERWTRRAELRERLDDATDRVAASAYFPSYDGARVGVVRDLDLDSAEPEAVRQVMDRYAMRLTVRDVTPSKNSGFLSSASAGGSVYTPARRGGLHEVFEISAKAYERMVWLENEWLTSHGHNPRFTRIDTVRYGVVSSSGAYEWDLGIVDIKIQKVDVDAPPALPTE